jgi:hypothetical protein
VRMGKFKRAAGEGAWAARETSHFSRQLNGLL